MMMLATFLFLSSSGLASVLPAADAFPACARGREVSVEQGMCDMTANPHVSRDRAFVACMTEEFLAKAAARTGGEAVKPEHVSEALVALYETDESAIYVVGFEFQEAARATAAAKAWEAALDQEALSLSEQQRATNPRPAVLSGGRAMAVVGCHVRQRPACCNEVMAAVAKHWKTRPGAAGTR